MQHLQSLLFAALAVSSALARSSGIDAAIAKPVEHHLSKRGPIKDIVGILQHKKKVGSDFCSTFLHLPPFAATTMITQTQKLTITVPRSTATVDTVLTSTAAPVLVVSTTGVVVAVTPTTEVVVPTIVPSTSTVATVTSVTTATTVVATEVITSYTPLAPRNAGRPHFPSRTRLPYWLDQYSCPQVSKACYHIVTPKTKTVTRTASATVTVKSGVVLIGKTSTAVLTPTTTSVATVTSTSTADAITSTIVTVSSSLVPVTATVDATEVVPVTGYVGPAVEPGYHEPVQNAADALTVRFPADFLVTGGPANFAVEGEFPNLGGIVGSGNSDSDFSSSSLNYAYMGAVNTVPANSQSSDTTGQNFNSAGYNKQYESQIWKVNPSTLVTTIDWANSNGDVFSSPTLFHDVSVGFLGWTGNFALFNARFEGETTVELVSRIQERDPARS
ncbi:hypothetical protein V8E36_008354 [Tilletia maclaganii]